MRLARVRELQLVDADHGAELRPRDLPIAGDQREQERAVLALHDERLHDVGGCDAEEARRLLERVRRRPLHEPDGDSARRGLLGNPLPAPPSILPCTGPAASPPSMARMDPNSAEVAGSAGIHPASGRIEGMSVLTSPAPALRIGPLRLDAPVV